MLERSPKLQVLKLVDVRHFIDFYSGSYFNGLVKVYIKFSSLFRLSQEYTKHRVSGWEWNKPKDIPECLLLHLDKI